MNRVKTTVRLNPNQAEKIQEYGKAISSTIEGMTEGFLAIRNHTLLEIKGFFTREELVALTDSLNGTLLEENFKPNKSMAIAHLEDFEQFENGISRHGADPDQLLAKIGNLTSAQIYFLQEEILRFWNVDNLSGERSFDEFVKNFTI